MTGGRQSRKRVGQSLAIERLDEKAIHAGLETRVTIVDQRVGGQRQDGRAAAGPDGFPFANFPLASMPSRCGIWTSIRTRS